MVKLHAAVLGAFGGLWASGVLGHPGGHEPVEDLEARALEVRLAGRAMAACAEKHQDNGFAKRNAERRAAKAAAIRKERNIKSSSWATSKRSLKSLDENHNHTMDPAGILENGPGSVYFDGSDPLCILASNDTIGPYYVDGELIRNDIVEKQDGVNVQLDLQIIDMTTCEPIPDMYVDVWHSNATGVYSGVVAPGNGNSNDTRNWNSTYARGIAPTDAEGAVQFNTLFPGHYTGRATHIHVLTHQEGKVLPNNTFQSGRASHVGQVYFDQDLITEVEESKPYTQNQMPITLNADDFLLQLQRNNSDADPVLDYVYLGDDITEGVFAWTTLVIDPKAAYDTPPMAHWTEDGGVPAGNGTQQDGPQFPGGPGNPGR